MNKKTTTKKCWLPHIWQPSLTCTCNQGTPGQLKSVHTHTHIHTHMHTLCISVSLTDEHCRPSVCSVLSTDPLHPRCTCGWWIQTHSPPGKCSCPCPTAPHSPWSRSNVGYGPVFEKKKRHSSCSGSLKNTQQCTHRRKEREIRLTDNVL